MAAPPLAAATSQTPTEFGLLGTQTARTQSQEELRPFLRLKVDEAPRRIPIMGMQIPPHHPEAQHGATHYANLVLTGYPPQRAAIEHFKKQFGGLNQSDPHAHPISYYYAHAYDDPTSPGKSLLFPFNDAEYAAFRDHHLQPASPAMLNLALYTKPHGIAGAAQAVLVVPTARSASWLCRTTYLRAPRLLTPRRSAYSYSRVISRSLADDMLMLGTAYAGNRATLAFHCHWDRVVRQCIVPPPVLGGMGTYAAVCHFFSGLIQMPEQETDYTDLVRIGSVTSKELQKWHSLSKDWPAVLYYLRELLKIAPVKFTKIVDSNVASWQKKITSNGTATTVEFLLHFMSQELYRRQCQ